eukprot:m.466002 g.466002  ORF g.466002 m.466002 type:complete len:63 (+) comp57057_c1_seq3:157-345(+)
MLRLQLLCLTSRIGVAGGPILCGVSVVRWTFCSVHGVVHLVLALWLSLSCMMLLARARVRDE